MTEDSAVSAFDLTSARPDTAHQQVGDSPGLPGTRNGRRIGLNRRPDLRLTSGDEATQPCVIMSYFGHLPCSAIPAGLA